MLSAEPWQGAKSRAWSAFMLVRVMHTIDGRLRVDVFEDQTAQILTTGGTTIVGRSPLFRIGRRLAEMGFAGADLIPD